MTEITVRGEGITVDLLLWRRYGPRYMELLEATYEANRGLAAHGIFLPLGTIVRIPDLPLESGATRNVLDLFG